jgi:putative membrane protein insertion efficiency factor
MSALAQRAAATRPTGRLRALARALLATPILAYRTLISPAIPRRCKYEPTCSRYALDAIGEFGALRGTVLAAWRVLRCNPWSYGGYDPVSAQRLFRRSSGGPGESL